MRTRALASVALAALWPTTALARDKAPEAAARATGIVHIDAPQPVVLEALDNDGEWGTLCTSPCDRAIPTDGSYRITGNGIRDSHKFHLDPAERTTLVVEPTSSDARTAAVTLTILGGIALLPVAGVTSAVVVGEIAGLIFICPFVAAFQTDKSKQSSAYGGCLGDIGSYFAAGYTQPGVWIPAIAGGVALTGGIVGLASTPATGVRAASAGATVTLDAPAWTAHLAGITLPAPITYPVIDLPF